MQHLSTIIETTVNVVADKRIRKTHRHRYGRVYDRKFPLLSRGKASYGQHASYFRINTNPISSENHIKSFWNSRQWLTWKVTTVKCGWFQNSLDKSYRCTRSITGSITALALKMMRMVSQDGLYNEPNRPRDDIGACHYCRNGTWWAKIQWWYHFCVSHSNGSAPSILRKNYWLPC